MTVQQKEKDAREKIKDLREWFDTAGLPAGPVKLCPGVTVVDVKRFVETSLSRLESMELRSKTMQMAYVHLTDFKNVLLSNG